MLTFTRVIVLLTLGSALVVPGLALAGPTEVFDGVFFAPSDPQLIVLSYDQGLGGLLVSRDGGHTFQLRPSLSFTTTGIRARPALAVLSDGTLYLGTDEGLFHDDGKGCHYTRDDVTGGAPIEDIARHPGDPRVAFILTASVGSGRGGVYRRAADGTITAVGADDPVTFVARGLGVVTRLASVDGVRLIEVGSTRPGDMDAPVTNAAPIFRTSDDLGMTWQSHSVQPSDGDIRLLAVDPADPDRALVGLSREGLPDPPDSVLLTTDGGATFGSYLENVAELGQSAVASDGRFWLAGTSGTATGGGLWFAPRIGDPLTQLLDSSTYCVGHAADRDTLYVCRRFELGQLGADPQYCRITQFTEAAGFPLCAGEGLLSNTTVRAQLCNAYCGATHYASAPLCGLYDTDVPAACGVPARSIDAMNYGWPSSGPPDDGTKRCAGFERASVLADAGTDAAIEEPPTDASVRTAPQHDGGCSLIAGADVRVGFIGMLLGVLARRRRRRTY